MLPKPPSLKAKSVLSVNVLPDDGGFVVLSHEESNVAADIMRMLSNVVFIMYDG